MQARHAVLPALALVLGAACASAPAEVDTGDLANLCEARQVATPAEVRELFEGPTHQALHDLADELQAADMRPVAGDVLETKQAVEAAFLADPIPADLQDRLSTLIKATNRGLGALHKPTLPCAD